MQAGKVMGSVVATVKNEALVGVKLLLVQLFENNKPGKIIVAGDAIKVAGTGEFVYLVSSREAAIAFGKGLIPIDAGIVGIIDKANLNSIINCE